MSWSENYNIITKIFGFSLNYNAGGKGRGGVCSEQIFELYINLLCVSKFYNSVGRHVLEKSDKQYGCKCDCKKMKRYKIEDVMKRWNCKGCDERISDNCWKKSEYYEALRGELAEVVCKECYENHWVNILHRPLILCTTNDRNL